MSTTYPLTKKFNSSDIAFRPMTPKDESAVLDFAQSLPDADLIYLRMDITDPEVVEEWVDNIKAGRTITVLAEDDGQIVGYGSLHLNRLLWTRHMGEMRILVDARTRGEGLGRSLAGQLYDIAKGEGLYRVIVQLPAEQPRVRAMFEELGFEPQAILPDWLKDRHNRPHDLVIMSRNIAG